MDRRKIGQSSTGKTMTQHGRGQTRADAPVLQHRYGLTVPEGAEILTLHGCLPVEYLCSGDRIITRDGARSLAAVQSAVLRDAVFARVALSSIGHDRPDAALHLPPDQPLLIRDWRAQALFGVRMALVPASRLVDGSFIRLERLARQRMYRLHFADPVVIYAGGLELGCLTERVAA